MSYKQLTGETLPQRVSIEKISVRIFFFSTLRCHATLGWSFSAGVSFPFNVLPETDVSPIAPGINRTTPPSICLLLRHQEGKEALELVKTCHGAVNDDLEP